MSKDIRMKYTADIAEVKEALEKANTATRKAMDDVDELQDETEKATKQTKALKKETDDTAKNTMTVLRRGVGLLHLFTGSSRNAVVQSVNILAKAALITAETVFEIATAEAATVVGAINAVVGFATAMSLFAQAQIVYMFGKQAANRFDDIDRSIQAANIVFAGW